MLSSSWSTRQMPTHAFSHAVVFSPSTKSDLVYTCLSPFVPLQKVHVLCDWLFTWTKTPENDQGMVVTVFFFSSAAQWTRFDWFRPLERTTAHSTAMKHLPSSCWGKLPPTVMQVCWYGTRIWSTRFNRSSTCRHQAHSRSCHSCHMRYRRRCRRCVRWIEAAFWSSSERVHWSLRSRLWNKVVFSRSRLQVKLSLLVSKLMLTIHLDILDKKSSRTRFSYPSMTPRLTSFGWSCTGYAKMRYCLSKTILSYFDSRNLSKPSMESITVSLNTQTISNPNIAVVPIYPVVSASLTLGGINPPMHRPLMYVLFPMAILFSWK